MTAACPPITICTKVRKPQSVSRRKRTSSVRNPYQIRGKLTKEKMNSVQRLLDYNAEYAEFHRLTALVVRAERAVGHARCTCDTEREAAAIVTLEALLVPIDEKFPCTPPEQMHKFEALARRWSAHGMFHAKEMGFADSVPSPSYLAAWINEHGTAEEILGPAAKYNPDCL